MRSLKLRNKTFYCFFFQKSEVLVEKPFRNCFYSLVMVKKVF